jgi:hypothetical protein
MYSVCAHNQIDRVAPATAIAARAIIIAIIIPA